MSKKLGLKEVIAMGVGGMVSGGIFAVLGVAMHQAGNAVSISFLLAGILTLLTAYSYVKLTLYYGEEGGAFSFIEHVVKNKNFAGFFGWILIAGYIGVMAMYSHAFGAYLAGLFNLTDTSLFRKVFSVGIVAFLIGVNLMGIKKSGYLEDILVYIKVAFLIGISVLGVYFFHGDFPNFPQFFNKGFISPIAGFAVIFVAYEGFQLLCYDYREIKDVERNLTKGMIISIFMAMIIYLLISFMSALYLTPRMVVQFKEYALAKAVVPFLGSFGFGLVVLTAIQSTASGINATLFGSSRLAHKIAKEKELPRVFSFRNKEGIPVYALLITGSLTAIFSVFGSLEQITEFGSVAFIIADGAANFANLRLYRETNSHLIIPLLGFLGCVIALPIIVYHLFLTEPHILFSIAGIFIFLLLLELLYMERNPIERVAEEIEEV
ncbi:MAG: APC family permease [Candidatus Aenigmatarchaeota archaeon]